MRTISFWKNVHKNVAVVVFFVETFKKQNKNQSLKIAKEG